MFQGNEDRIGVLPLKPLLCFQSCFWACRVGIQVILEEVRLKARRGHKWSDAFGWKAGGGFPCPAAGGTHLSRDRHDDGLALPLVELEEPLEEGRRVSCSQASVEHHGWAPSFKSPSGPGHTHGGTSMTRGP